MAKEKRPGSFERKELLESLKLVEPALARDPPTPVLSHLCFEDGTVTAFDDMVALRAPCGCLDIHGAVPGEKMISLLSMSRVKEMTAEVADDTLQLKLGRTRINLTMLPPTDFLFREPECTGPDLVLKEAIIRVLKLASRSVDKEASSGSRFGITMVFGKKKMTVYASDSFTIFRAVLDHTSPKLAGTSLILPERFYKQLLNLDANTRLVITDHDDLKGVAKGVDLFGKRLHGADQAQFESVFTDFRVDKMHKDDVPESLARSLRRALVVTKENTEFRYSGGKLKLTTKVPGCELIDVCKIDLGPDDVTTFTCAEYVLRFLDEANRIGIGPHCIILQGPGFDVMVGSRPQL